MTSKSSMRRVCRWALGMSTYPRRWSAHTPMRVASGCGNMSARPRSRRGTHGQGSSGGITSTHWPCNGRCRPLSGRQRSPRRRVAIRCATHVRPICSKRGTTSGRCRNDSGTKTSVRQCYTPTGFIRVVAGSRVQQTCWRRRAEWDLSSADGLAYSVSRTDIG